MRIRRRSDAPLSCSTRGLVGITILLAFAVWWGAFAASMAVVCTTVLYAVLCLASAYVARMALSSQQRPYSNWRFSPADDDVTLRTFVIVYIIFHYAWHLYWLMVLLPAGYQDFWHVPVLGPLTLAQVEHLTLSAIFLLLIVSFLSRVYAGEAFSQRVCIETSALLTFLLATHFAVP